MNRKEQKKYIEQLKKNPLINMNAKYYRTNTKWHQTRLHFLFGQGGVGDYINWIPAFEWLIKENPHIKGFIYVPDSFYEFFNYAINQVCQNHKWDILKSTEFKSKLKTGDGVVNINDFKLFINATGSHLMDFGFMVYCCLQSPPKEYNRLPVITYSDKESHQMLNEIGDKPYAVFTPGATSKVRTMPAKAFNTLVEYVSSKGVTPVFLGRNDFAQSKTYFATFDKDYDFTKGVSLLNRTSLLQANHIISNAKFVLGLDNGLLHLAGTTKTPILFGHTITDVHHRDIRRLEGKTINITVKQELLKCIGCQSHMRYIIGHKFVNCVYNDNICLEYLFSNDCETWKQAIDIVLGET